VRGGDVQRAPGPEQTVKLVHGANHVGDVLNDMNRTDMIEAGVPEGIRKTVQIAQNIRRGA
jgi:hypothetical protein